MATVSKAIKINIPALASKNAAKLGRGPVSVRLNEPGRFGLDGGRYVPEP